MCTSVNFSYSRDSKLCCALIIKENLLFIIFKKNRLNEQKNKNKRLNYILKVRQSWVNKLTSRYLCKSYFKKKNPYLSN